MFITFYKTSEKKRKYYIHSPTPVLTLTLALTLTLTLTLNHSANEALQTTTTQYVFNLRQRDELFHKVRNRLQMVIKVM